MPKMAVQLNWFYWMRVPMVLIHWKYNTHMPHETADIFQIPGPLAV